MAKSLSSGVDIEIADDTYTLKPSLKAANAISRRFGGFMGAQQAVINQDLGAFQHIVRQAISMKAISTEDLEEAVYAAGTTELMSPVLKYVRILMNGGRDPEDEDEGGTARGADDDEGNGGN